MAEKEPFELNFAVAFELNPGGLDSALRAALGNMVLGVSTYGPNRPISVWLEQTRTPADEALVQSVLAAHDPLFLSCDKAVIAANATDAATVTVTAGLANPSPVTLLVNGVSVPVAMVNGLGTVMIQWADPAEIVVSVKNPINRSTDVLVIQAV